VAVKLRVGIDVASAAEVAHSIATFGEAYLNKVFTVAELAHARKAESTEVFHQRLAARFAAREAAIKAFRLAHVGVAWRDIEVVTADDGAPTLVLHGRAKQFVGEFNSCAISMSHQGDHATAIVVVL
jgi:holo-[acyl-carrier protein] synthase